MTRKADREKTKRNNHDVPASPVKQMSKSQRSWLHNWDEQKDAVAFNFI